MTKLEEFERLYCLHDAVVWSIEYAPRDANGDGRRLTMIVDCDPEAGYAPWDGRRLKVVLDDVAFLSCDFIGAITGLETIDAWRPVASDSVEAMSKNWPVEFDGQRFGVCFHSGSEMDGICKSINVDVISETPARGDPPE